MYHIIANPIAGRGRTVAHLHLLTALFDTTLCAYEVHQTDAPLHAYELAKRLCHTEAIDGLIGIGGDGTFQELAAGMVDAFPHGQKLPVPLGIFPGGSGNDFIMSVESGKRAALKKYRTSPAKAAQNFFDTVMRGHTRTIDVITANDMAFLNVGNIGLDARIVANAAALKQRYGRYAYLAAVYKTIASHENLPLKITADGMEQEGKYTLVAACNGQYYGGGMRIAPRAHIADGKITLTVVDEISRARTMVLFPSLLIEKHESLRQVSFIECEEVTMECATPQTLCLDGNLYPMKSQVTFKCLPQVLDVFV
jgi:YegS/Rv2252/BmrU family lipid kinase